MLRIILKIMTCYLLSGIIMADSGMNVVLIISDTLRKDYLGFYGNATIHTPNIDAFAKKCVVFENHYAASFPTVPTRADLFTGKWTFTKIGWNPMPEDETVLPEILQSEGFSTAAIVDTPFYIREGFHYDRGFDLLVENYGQRRPVKGTSLIQRKVRQRDFALHHRIYEEDYFAPTTLRIAEHWLEQYYTNAQPFFLLVDTWDPHEPWDPPAWYVKLYKPNYAGEIVSPTYNYIEGTNVKKSDIETALACYCGEITMVDEAVGRFLRKMENMKLMDNTIVIFTSDHGFYFGEHGIFGKSITGMPKSKIEGQNAPRDTWLRSPLYEEIIRIPLMIYHPRVEPKRVKSLTSAIDIMPTILDLINVKKPSVVQGISFTKLITGINDTEHREFVVSSPPLKNPGDSIKMVDSHLRQVMDFLPITITTKKWSLIYSSGEEQAELYDLENDPKQERNVINEHPEIAVKLHRYLLSVLESSKVEPRLTSPRETIKLHI